MESNIKPVRLKFIFILNKNENTFIGTDFEF